MQLIHYVKHGNAGDKNPSSLVIKSKQDQQKKKRKNSVKTRYKTAGNDTSHTRSGTDHRSTRRSRWRRWWVVGFCCSDEKKPDRLIDCSIISTLFLFWLSECVCVCVCVCGGSFWLFVSFLLDVYLKRKTRFLERVPDGVFLLFVVAFVFLRVCVCVCVCVCGWKWTRVHTDTKMDIEWCFTSDRTEYRLADDIQDRLLLFFLSLFPSFFLSFFLLVFLVLHHYLVLLLVLHHHLPSSFFFLFYLFFIFFFYLFFIIIILFLLLLLLLLLLLVLLALHLLFLLLVLHHHLLPPPSSSSSFLFFFRFFFFFFFFFASFFSGSQKPQRTARHVPHVL